jgi:hypothetical protein
VKIDAMAVAMNPNRRRLADALAFPKNEFKGRFAALKTL